MMKLYIRSLFQIACNNDIFPLSYTLLCLNYMQHFLPQIVHQINKVVTRRVIISRPAFCIDHYVPSVV
jgi:hypothetical protein